MNKNSKLHIAIETKLLESLKEKAKSKNISLAEYCRSLLSQNFQLNRIEFLLRSVLNEHEK